MNADARTLLQVSAISAEITKGKRRTTAIEDISFDVRPGEVVAIVGETGSGKSLTALSVMGLIKDPVRLSGGSVELADRDLTKLKPAELRRLRGGDIAMIFQDPMTALNPFHTVGQQIAETIALRNKVSGAEMRSRIIRLLTEVGVVNPQQRIRQYPHELSGGTQQRVMIAMALANEPKLLVADEPTTGLDATVQAQILQLIRDASQSRQMGVLLITHDLGVVSGASDRVVVMYAGQVVESGPTAGVLDDATHPYTRALLGATPRTDNDSTRLASIPGSPPELFRFPPGCRFAPRCSFATDECRSGPPKLLTNPAGPDREVRCIHPQRGPLVHAQLPDSPGEKKTAAVPAAGETSISATALQITDLRRHFEIGHGRNSTVTKAVDGVSLELNFGETLGIVGESGCGKSTLAKLIAGLDDPTGGSVTYDGGSALDARANSVDRTFVQYVFQDTFGSLNPRHTVMQIISEPLRNLTDMTKTECLARVREYMAACGLPPSLENRYPHELSGGQRQRVGICRALVVRPKVVVMDEPMSGLDLSVQAQIVNLLQDLKRDFGLTTVLVSHDIGVIRHLCDRVAVMYLGRLMEVGPGRELLDDPLHPYTTALMSAVPLADPALEAQRRPIVLKGDVGDVDPTAACGFAVRCPAAQPICRTNPVELEPQGRGLRVACHTPGVLRDNRHAPQEPAVEN